MHVQVSYQVEKYSNRSLNTLTIRLMNIYLTHEQNIALQTIAQHFEVLAHVIASPTGQIRMQPGLHTYNQLQQKAS
jgi:hypothetical protein